MDAKAVSKYLSALIERSGQTYQDIDDGCGVPKATISRLIRGSTQNPQTQTVATLVEYLGGSMDELAGIQKQEEHTMPETVKHVRDPWEEIDKAHQAHVHALESRIKSQGIAIIVLSIILLAFVCWFIWDITHPEIGLIRLKQAGYLGHLLGMQ